MNNLPRLVIISLLVAAGSAVACNDHPNQPNTVDAGHVELYQCPMHPQVTSHEPGDCPICGMRLVPVKSDSAEKPSTSTPGGERKVLYWVAPMDPNYRSDEPGKSPMGMDLVPVYADAGSGSGVSVSGRTTVHVPDVQRQRIGVRTAVATIQPRAIRTLRTVGTVEPDPDRVQHVHTKVAGWVEKVYVRAEANRVRAGQVLYELYSPQLVATQDELIAAVAAKNPGAANAARQRLRNWDVSEVDIKAIEQLQQAKRSMPFRSPMDGFVRQVQAIEGMQAGEMVQLYELVSLETVWVLAKLYERELNLVTVGQAARITVPGGTVIDSTVDYVYPFVNEQSRFVNVRLKLPNPGIRLRPGMYVDVGLQADLGPGLLVPADAVLRTGTRSLVFVEVAPGQFEPRQVDLGPQVDGGFILHDGVADGEIVAVQANFFLDSESALRSALTSVDTDDSNAGK